MGKQWGAVLILLALSSNSVLALESGRQRSIATEEIQVKEHLTGTISRIDGKRLRISEDPDPMGCATSGIKMVDIVERTKLFRGDIAISDNNLQRGDHVTLEATHRGEILEAIEIRVQALTVPDPSH
ncbi:MAG TPA: hypothetical protein VMS18_15175 [Candidatus Binatia bacterium]|nr:hypothetical protein [Candidatus Binatia bacterium]